MSTAISTAGPPPAGPARQRRGRWSVRRVLTMAAAVAVALAMTAQPMTAAAAAAAPAADPGAKIESALSANLAANGTGEFMVFFHDRADTSSAKQIKDWGKRGEAVMNLLRKAADASQADVREQLDAAKAAYTPFWIVNAIHVQGGSLDLARQIAADAEVKQVAVTRTYQLPTPIAGTSRATVNAVEWGLSAIRADEAWTDFGATGDDIVIANVDTGVDFEHPALVRQYRGNNGDGTFDHQYNWFDPSQVCGSPSLAPCDNNSHGTHTMGTMVGDDGAGNQIGVAPGAKWIAAKGCESSSCSQNALLRAGQWIAAPTDLNDENPRPDLRPHIVNNSWGGGGGADPWYKEVVANWINAGIFPAFSNGNSGSACETAGTPGDYSETYASGAYDVTGAIASFSSRGPGENGDVKPDIAAPGVDVRSSVPGGGYDEFSGTSMASPHTAGVVALMWSAAAGLVGEIDATKQLLDGSAVDVDDTTCGGTAANNNVWGEGRLDAYTAVEESPRGPTGTVTGTVTDQATGQPVNGATVRFTGGVQRQRTTGADGTFTAKLPVGDYTVAVTAFGYHAGEATVTVTDGQTTTHDPRLTAKDTVEVTGKVADGSGHGWPLYSRIDVGGRIGEPMWTDPVSGQYRMRLPVDGSYPVTFTSVVTGYQVARETVTVGSADVSHNVAVVIGAGCTAPGYRVGADGCVVVPGGLVAGTVDDANTGDAVNGATVASAGQPADKGTTVATPGDPNLGDGFFWLFSSLTGAQPFTAGKARYQSTNGAVTVAADDTVWAEFTLAAGRLVVEPATVARSQQLGKSSSATVKITNNGSAPAALDLTERQGASDVLGKKGAPLRLIKSPTSQAFRGKSAGSDGADSLGLYAGQPQGPTWTAVAPYPIPIIDNSAASLYGKVYSVGGHNGNAVTDAGYVYDPFDNAWSPIANMPLAREKADIAFVGGKLYVTGGWDAGGTSLDQVDVYDPATNTWDTVASVNPAARTASGVAVVNDKIYYVAGCADSFCNASDRVVRYDPASDTWHRLAAYPHPAAWMSCGGIGTKVYCAGGASGNTVYSDAHVYDPATDTWTAAASLPIPLWGSAGSAANGLLVVSSGVTSGNTITNQGFAYDPSLDSWAPLPNAQFPRYRQAGACGFYKLGGSASGTTPAPEAENLSGLDQCGVTDVPWLAQDTTTKTLRPGESVTISLALTATTATGITQPGTYTAEVAIGNDTPYRVAPIAVTMTVTPPKSWGKATGTVTGSDCLGRPVTLRGVSIQADGKDGNSFSLKTDAAGGYTFWAPANSGPYTVLASKDGWVSQTQQVRLTAGGTTTANFALRPLGC